MPDHRRRRPDRLPALPRRAPPPHPALQLHRTHLRRDPPPGQGHRAPARRDQLPHPGVGRARPGLPRLARPDHDPRRPAPAAGPAPLPARAPGPAAAVSAPAGPALTATRLLPSATSPPSQPDRPGNQEADTKTTNPPETVSAAA